MEQLGHYNVVDVCERLINLGLFRGDVTGVIRVIFRNQPVYDLLSNNIPSYHWILMATEQPVGDLITNGVTTVDFYRNEHNVELRHLDMPAFVSLSGNIIPPELTYTAHEAFISMMRIELYQGDPDYPRLLG
jgi:hypothetical protein